MHFKWKGESNWQYARGQCSGVRVCSAVWSLKKKSQTSACGTFRLCMWACKDETSFLSKICKRIHFSSAFWRIFCYLCSRQPIWRPHNRLNINTDAMNVRLKWISPTPPPLSEAALDPNCKFSLNIISQRLCLLFLHPYRLMPLFHIRWIIYLTPPSCVYAAEAVFTLSCQISAAFWGRFPSCGLGRRGQCLVFFNSCHYRDDSL